MKKINLIEWLSRNSHEKQSPQRFGRYAAMLMMLLTIGVGQMWAGGQYNMNWQGKVYFRVPDNWDLSTYSHVQIALTRTTSTTESNYVDYIGEMSRIGTTRLYYFSINCNHSGWNQNEYVLFTANSSQKTTTTNTIQYLNQYYTTPLDYGFNNGSNYYLCNPTSENNGASVSADWNSSRDDLAKLAQTVTLYTNGSESYAGGTVTINGTYFTGDNTVSTSSTSNSSSTSAAYSNVVGATVTLTATESDGYSFVGWYDSSSGDLISADKEHSYICKAAKEIDAKWIPYYCNTALSATSFTTGAGTDISLTCSIVDSKYRITVKGTGLTSISPGVYYKYGGVGDGHQLITDATLVTNSSTNITYDIPANAKTPVFYTDLFVVRASQSAYDQIKDKTIDWSYSCGVTNYSVTYNGSSASGSVPTDNSIYTSGDEVTVLGANTLSMDNYSFSGWNTSSDMSGTDRAVSSTFNISANTTLYAKWTQTITLDANLSNHGTGDNGSATAVWNKAGLEEFSATSGENGYRLLGYYTASTGGTKILNADGSFAESNITDYITSGKWSRTAAAPTLYAHWASDEWKWYTSTTYQQTFINTGTDEYKLNIEVTNDNKGSWKFVLNDNLTTWYYTGAEDAINTDITLASGTGYKEWTGNSGANGHYTLRIWKDNGVWKYRAYASPQITFTASPTGGNVKADSESDGSNITSGTYIMYNTEATFTATPASHYTLEGWYSASDLSGDNLGTTNPLTVSNVTSNTARYAKFALEQYTITLDIDESHHGTIDGKTTSQVVDYRGATTTVPYLPTGADGYKFMGFYTETGGGGTQVINADGTWIASVDSYTDEDKKWIHDADAALYAYYQAATITSLALPGGSVYTVGGSAFTATATVSAFDGNALVCWQVKNSREEEVSTTFTPASGNSVTVSIPATPGSYKVVASLKAGTTCSGDVLHTAQQSFTVQGNYTVSITGGTGSANVGEETTATVTADAATAGMKFDHWNVTGTISYTSGDVNSRTITFTASSNITLTAVYTERDTKKVYFAKPSGWSKVYAYAWQNSNTSNKNGEWAATEITANTETVKGTTYHYYEYYIDDNGETGGDKTNQNAWDRIIFHQGTSPGTAQSTKTADLTLVGGHFYHIADGNGENGRDAATLSGSASAEDWYVCGYWNASTNDWGFAHPINLNGGTSGNVNVTGLTASSTQQFKIYRASTDQWFKWTGGASVEYNPNKEITIGEPMTLREYNLNRNTFTSYATEYLFALDITSTSNPVLTVAPNDMTEYSTTLSIDGHGSLDKSTGTIQLKQYVPTTITATPETSYRFKQWTVTGNVVCSSTTSATATFTATGAGGTITAEFTNDEVIYFDAGNIENEWGNDVYVTFLSANFEWNDGDGKDGALIVKNWVDNALHSVRMTRIPNTRIFYLDYSGLSGHDQVKQYVLFTSKSLPNNIYNLYEMAAVTRGDYKKASGNNMCVAENFREKDKNKTGYYCGYWMNYNDTKAGINLRIYSGGGSEITSADGDFTLSAAGSRTYTATVPLSANTTYKMELQGYNNTYYKNNGTMVSTNCTAWPYVDRQATVGYITTTAAGEYKFTLNCADKLYLTADFPLAVNDYKLVFSGKVAVGGIDETYSSSVIRHIGDEGTKKDTLGFFVVNGDSWSLQLQRCTSIDPIRWVNMGSAQAASAFGNPATGTYNFVVQQDSSAGTPVIPAFATMTPEAYTGNYYIRTDAADGGWEAYKKALDNQMIFSNYAKSQSNFDYYHCRFANNGTNVKFCIANDYSARLSDTLYTDSYVNTGEGVLPADASVRFMWNSETNVLSRAYLNGSHTTDFLLLEAKADSLKNFDGTVIAEAGILGSVKFKDMGNWIYQKEVQALPGTRVRLTSNYRFSSSDHIQYFKGESGEWSGANTEQIIGGTTNSWEKLRLVYDFKTNHLTSAWLPPTSTITDEKSINADMLLIRRGQNAAQQLTFGGSGKIANVKTIVGAMEFVKDSIVGRVSHFNGDVIGASGNRANRELMHYISFPFDVAVNDIYGFGQLNKEWYLQYYDGAERASKGFFRGDGTTTFWKYMTLADTLRANVGYSLLLDNDYFNTTGEGTVWHNTISDSIYLYFPSAKELSADSVIKSGTKTIRVPEHKHTSGRTFEVESRTLCHDFTDSDWNMMGVPLFQNQRGLAAYFDDNADPTDWPAEGKGYFYEWDSLSNNFEIHTAAGYTFKSMHGYMVQYSGSVSFTGASIQPASSVVARRAPKSGENYLLELQLLKENKRTSRTYIELREEACDTFALDEDVYMVYTSHPADLYTYAGNYDVSANVLSMDNHSIPVGIEVHQAGEYTFTMPSSFNGAATLIDTQTGARTNLALGDYTVSLPKGVCDGRFFIELDLNKMPTAIDGVTDGSVSLRDGNAHKFIENGIMYILRDGILYDARGNKVK